MKIFGKIYCQLKIIKDDNIFSDKLLFMKIIKIMKRRNILLMGNKELLLQ